MMIDLADRLRNRYERSFSVMRIDTSLTTAQQEKLGASGQAKAQKLVTDLLRETVRETDFLALIDKVIIVFLPETPHDNSAHLVDRLNDKVVKVMGDDATLDISLMAEPDVPALVSALGKA